MDEEFKKWFDKSANIGFIIGRIILSGAAAYAAYFLIRLFIITW